MKRLASPRILFYSDFHFRKQEPAAEGVLPRLEFQLLTCQWIATVVRNLRPDYVVNAGDSNHVQGHIEVESLSAMARGIGQITDAAESVNAKHLILAGNHDQADRAGTSSVVPALVRKGAPGFESSGVVDGRVALVAYHADSDVWKATVQQLVGSAPVLVMHQDVAGALWTPSRPAEHGVSAKDVRRFSHVFCGHYHHPQVVAERIHVIGAPCYYDWNDHVIPDLPRGVAWFDGTECRWLANPHTPIRHTIVAEKSREVVEWLDWAEATPDVVPLACPLLLRVKVPTRKNARAARKKIEAHSMAPRIAKLLVSTTADGEYRSVELESELDLRVDDPRKVLEEFLEKERASSGSRLVSIEEDVAHPLDHSRLLSVGLEAMP